MHAVTPVIRVRMIQTTTPTVTGIAPTLTTAQTMPTAAKRIWTAMAWATRATRPTTTAISMQRMCAYSRVPCSDCRPIAIRSRSTHRSPADSFADATIRSDGSLSRVADARTHSFGRLALLLGLPRPAAMHRDNNSL